MKALLVTTVASVMALTLAVTTPAFAADPVASAAPPPAASAAPAAAPQPTPTPAEARPTLPAPPSAPSPQPDQLVLRAARPINLAPEPAPTPWPYKMAFAALVAGACVVAWKKRDRLRTLLATKSEAKPALDVRVLGRTPMGLRGEIVLVEAGGSRVLVGVTATSMTTLALLPDDGAAAAQVVAAEEIEREVEEEPALGERARVLLGARPAPATFSAHRYAESAPEPPPRPSRAKPRRVTTSDAPLEGQARGLAFALGNSRGSR